MIRGLYCSLAGLMLLVLNVPVRAQFGDGATVQAPPREIQITQWKVGMIVEAVGGPCKGMYGTVPVPTDWPEQRVRVVQEDVSANVGKVRYRMVAGGVKQMLITIPNLAPGDTATAVVTFEVEREQLPPPQDTDSLRIPEKLDRELKKLTGPSPYIESRHKQIRDLAAKLRDDSLPAWQQVEKFYDFVRDNVEYKNGELKGALRALRDGFGDCEELTSLFIALCRAHGIPARTVWVPGHCYPEFYLEDAQGVGHWIACEAAGEHSFGSVGSLNPILQKGDNFVVPEKKERQRYVAEFLTGKASAGRPRARFVREEIRQR